MFQASQVQKGDNNIITDKLLKCLKMHMTKPFVKTLNPILCESLID